MISSSRAMWTADWITRTRAWFWELTPVPTTCTMRPSVVGVGRFYAQ